MLSFVRPVALRSRVPLPPPDGQGLNPLLQNFYMVIHPPTMYLGFVGLTIPFAFGLAALITGHLDDSWLRAVRRWTMVGWMFLTFGLGLGMLWAYEELGWGGYWAWDPVENAAFMPLLSLAAFVQLLPGDWDELVGNATTVFAVQRDRAIVSMGGAWQDVPAPGVLSPVRHATVTEDGTLYIADTQNHRIRRVGTNGIISTVVGDGTQSCPLAASH